MRFETAREEDFDLIYQMMLRAKEKLITEGIFQWGATYPKPEMLLSDLQKGYTSLVFDDSGNKIAFFTYNYLCEDDAHEHVKWLNPGDKWVFLHRLCIDPKYQSAGNGKRIVALFEEMVAPSVDSIRVDVFSTNQKAIHIYEKYGFQRLAECMCDRGMFYAYEKLLKS